MNTAVLQCFILFLTIFILILTLNIKHAPRYKIDPITRKKIEKYGLIHFTFSSNTESIIKNGLIANMEKPMSKLETDMLWFYIADPKAFGKNLMEVKSKGKRNAVDTVVFFRPEHIDYSRLKMRKKPEAIVHIGSIPASYLEVSTINEFAKKIATSA